MIIELHLLSTICSSLGLELREDQRRNAYSVTHSNPDALPLLIPDNFEVSIPETPPQMLIRPPTRSPIILPPRIPIAHPSLLDFNLFSSFSSVILQAFVLCSGLPMLCHS